MKKVRQRLRSVLYVLFTMLSTLARLVGLVVTAGSLVRGFSITSNTNVRTSCCQSQCSRDDLRHAVRLLRTPLAELVGSRTNRQFNQLLGSKHRRQSRHVAGSAEDRLLLPGKSLSHVPTPMIPECWHLSLTGQLGRYLCARLRQPILFNWRTAEPRFGERA